MAAAVGTLMIVMAGSVQAATVPVSSINFQFQPQSRTINLGDVVSWTFAGDPHTVTSGAPGSPDGRFSSGIKDPGGSFQVTFNSAGTFPYFCEIHPEQMIGSIVVAGGSTPAPTAPSTPKPTIEPTAKPTSRPTATPTATPTAAPSPARTTAPSATPTDPPAVSPSAATPPAATATPAASASPGPTGPSQSPAASPGTSAQATAAPTVDGAPAGSLEMVPILAIAVVVGLLFAAGVALARRPRAG